ILTAFGMPATATVGGVPAAVAYAGAAPLEIAGLAQFNVQIPANAPVGGAVPLVVTIGPWAAQISTTVAVK
ncbi:MAG: hypothetical protein KGN84_07375, partial [Acidobacteriota bacterium]|nr:hypothetical protein [Acidobacteriota bacterium]